MPWNSYDSYIAPSSLSTTATIAMNKDQNSTLSAVGFKLKAYTVKQLSELCGVTAKTFHRWIKPIAEQIGRRQGYFYNITQVRCIVAHLGVPGDVVID